MMTKAQVIFILRFRGMKVFEVSDPNALNVDGQIISLKRARYWAQDV